MKYALIKNQKVENVIVADGTFVESIKNEWDSIISVDESAPVSIGWIYVNNTFEPPVPTVQVSIVPQSITSRQFKLALLKINKLGSVALAIESLTPPVKEEVEIEWQYATTVTRDGFVVALCTALGLNNSQIDDLFHQ